MASEKILKTKEVTVKNIKEKMQKANAVIFFDYRGLTVEEFTKLRNQLKEEEGSDIKVYKNTLTKRALAEMQISMDEFMNGPNAMAYSKDIILPAKVLFEGSKKNPNLKIKVGIIEGKVTDLETINKLAVIPPRQTLLTMLAAGLMGTVRNLSISLNMLAKQKEN